METIVLRSFYMRTKYNLLWAMTKGKVEELFFLWWYRQRRGGTAVALFPPKELQRSVRRQTSYLQNVQKLIETQAVIEQHKTEICPGG